MAFLKIGLFKQFLPQTLREFFCSAVDYQGFVQHLENSGSNHQQKQEFVHGQLARFYSVISNTVEQLREEQFESGVVISMLSETFREGARLFR
jgi:hypothetical protein